MINALGYKDSLRFLKEYNNITYPEFDYFSVHSLNLFSSFEDINLDDIEKEVSHIERVLPSMKRIFAKPIIHLIDQDEIVDVEAVRGINNRTISYASTHSELWDDITPQGIKPLKLLTTNYKDNYAIYENVAFSRAVDYSLAFCRHYSRLLKDMIYTNRKLEIDLLERENHMSYYLALGKLETGHLRSFSAYIDLALSLISRMNFIQRVLQARIRRPVYAKCHKVKGKLKLRKTNIFANQKDYRNVYRFLKGVYKNELQDIDEEEQEKAYLYFCKYLLVFSIGHFNFELPKDKRIDFAHLDLEFSFKEYHVKVKDTLLGEEKAIELSFYNDKEYKMLLLPSLLGDKKAETPHELHVLTDDFDTKETFVSISNIDSFRRLQQLLLKGMIYSTASFKTCPFCGGPLEKEEDSFYHCEVCRQTIKEEYCKETQTPYFVTSIYKFRPKKEEEESSGVLVSRENEDILHYRNIAEITPDLSFVCPCCHKVHKKG